MARKRIAEILTTRAPCGGNARKLSGLMYSSYTDETRFDARQSPETATFAAVSEFFGQP